MAIKVKSELLQGKKVQAIVNNYSKFEEIISTNSKDMRV